MAPKNTSQIPRFVTVFRVLCDFIFFQLLIINMYYIEDKKDKNNPIPVKINLSADGNVVKNAKIIGIK